MPFGDGGAPARIVNMHKHTCTLTTGQKRQRRHCCFDPSIEKLSVVLWSTLSIADQCYSCSPFASTNSFHFPLLVHQYILIHSSFLFPTGLLQRRLKTSSCTSHIPLQVPANKKKACMYPWKSIEASFLFDRALLNVWLWCAGFKSSGSCVCSFLCFCLFDLFVCRCLLVCMYRGVASQVVADGSVNDDHVVNSGVLLGLGLDEGRTEPSRWQRCLVKR